MTRAAFLPPLLREGADERVTGLLRGAANIGEKKTAPDQPSIG